jgi:hypothetical protein
VHLDLVGHVWSDGRVGQRTASLVGLVAGLVFVLLNAGPLPAPFPVVLRVLGVVVAVAILAYAVVAMPRRPSGAGGVPRRALRVYWICVAAEVVAIPVGRLVLVRLHQASLTPVWVVFVVGVHFLPFASAFRVPLFRVLAVALIAIAVAGAVAALLGGPVAVGWACVAAGFVLLAFAFASGWQERRRIAAGEA